MRINPIIALAVVLASLLASLPSQAYHGPNPPPHHCDLHPNTHACQ